jgi:hypothetical protein
MFSWPPATTTSMPSMAICFAAAAIAVRPLAHWRSIVCAPAVTGKPCGDRRVARDVEAGGSGIEHRADDDVLDLVGVDCRPLDRVPDRVGEKRRRFDVVQCAAKGASDRRTRGRHTMTASLMADVVYLRRCAGVHRASESDAFGKATAR